MMLSARRRVTKRDRTEGALPLLPLRGNSPRDIYGKMKGAGRASSFIFP